jgi:hypothetical protein
MTPRTAARKSAPFKKKFHSALTDGLALVIGVAGFLGIFLLTVLAGTPKGEIVCRVVFGVIVGLFCVQRLIDAHYGIYRGRRYRHRKLKLDDYMARAVVVLGVVGLLVGMSYCEGR